MSWKGVDYPEVTMQYGWERVPVEVWLDVQLDNQLVRTNLRIQSAVRLLKAEPKTQESRLIATGPPEIIKDAVDCLRKKYQDLTVVIVDR